MKRFAFSLSRVLDLRRQQASVEQARLQSLLRTLNQLTVTKQALMQQLEEARINLRQAPATGHELRAFVEYERHIHARCTRTDQDSQLIQRQIREQQAKTIEADRQVKLLENLKQRKLAEWTRECDKELEELAADSHLARMLAERRDAERNTAYLDFESE